MKTTMIGGLVAVACLFFASAAQAAPEVRVQVVRGGYTDIFTGTFEAGVTASVRIIGDGDTDLDLYVYDEFNNLIVKSDGPTDKEFVSWTPRWTGKFTIKVVNRSSYMSNRYLLFKN